MKRVIYSSFFIGTLLLAGNVFAMDLSQARSGGLVGEKLDGYAAVIGSNADAQNVVTTVNAKRRDEYEKISSQNGQPVSVVGKVAAEQIINGLPAGAFYQGADGSWKKK